MSAPLAPGHLAYLGARGITEATIAANGLYSARPQDLARLAGRPVPEGTSGLVIPYEGCDGFARVRLFPPIPNQDGREQKFGQPVGEPVRLYVPAAVREILADAERSLSIVEGEVKALALTQAGFPTVAIGGVWNFRSKDLPADGLIPNLEAVAWQGRPVSLVPDSDAWTNEQVLLAFYRLARRLEERDAAPLIVRIPPAAGGAKQGADDFLVAATTQGKDVAAAWRRLLEKVVALGHPAFRPFREAEKARARAEAPRHSATVEQVLATAKTRRLIRPGQAFMDGRLIYGVGVGDETLFLTSDRQAMTTETMREAYAFTGEPSGLPSHLTPGAIERFLRGEAPSLGEVFARVEAAFRRFFIWRFSFLPAAAATWVLGTYLFVVFRFFGYWWLNSPRKRCAKSTVLDLISFLAFHALGRDVNPTAATLFREVSEACTTRALEEVEGLRKKANDEARDILNLLNGAFQNGTTVARNEKTDGRWTPRRFHAYAPFALAGISQLPDTMEDRAFPIVMWPKTRGERVARFSLRTVGPELAALRDDLYLAGLSYGPDIAALYDKADILPLPEGLDDRARDILEPLFAVAAAVDAEREDRAGTVTKALQAFARDQAGIRASDDRQGATEAVVRALDSLPVGPEGYALPAAEVPALLRGAGLDWVDSKKKAGDLMGRVGLVSRTVPVGDSRPRGYWLTREVISDLVARFLPSGTSESVHLSEPAPDAGISQNGVPSAGGVTDRCPNRRIPAPDAEMDRWTD